MSVLVTGGAGFIGSNLVRLLLLSNFEVKVLDNLSTGYKRNIEGLDVEFVQGDVRDYELVVNITKGIDTIFHMAASIGNVKSLKYPREDSEVNVIGTVNVLEAARINDVKRLVYSSSAAIFGELLTMPIAEDHPQNPNSPYGVSKLAGEKQVLCYGALYDIKVVCLRYFNVYGINQRYDAYGNVIPIFANKLLNKNPLTIFGNGEQTRDFVNVKDVAMANYLAATKADVSSVYNVGSGKNITINQLAEYMKKISGVTSAIEYAPPRSGEVLHCRADITKLNNDLGFDPDTNIQKGLREYLDWFLNLNSRENISLEAK